MEETHNTLKFASRAKRVEINASRNRIIYEKSLIKKYQREISSLKSELDQLRRGIVVGVSNEEILSLRQQLEAGQVKMQSRLEEEEEAKAALMSRIQRLTKLILVSTKNTIPGCLGDLPTQQRDRSFGEDGKLDIFREASSLVESESILKDSTSYVLPDHLDPLSDVVHLRSSSTSNEEHPSVSSLVTESTQVGQLMGGTTNGYRIPVHTGISMSDQMDLFAEQVKMLAGEIALSSSTLKRLVEQSVNDPDGSQIQIRNLEHEISEKRRQMRALEQKIVENDESSMGKASLVDMQQTVMRLMTQCNEKGFELEIKSADNRILQEQLQAKCYENKELQEKVNLLQGQLASGKNGISSIPPESHLSEEINGLKSRLQLQETENVKLNNERLKLVEENRHLISQNQKFADETSYAKELASAAAVELKNLAEEVTKLSLQNARQAKELCAAQDMIHSRAGIGGVRKYSDSRNEAGRVGRKGRPASRGSEIGNTIYDDVESWNIELDDLRLELQARKQRESALEAALAEKEFIEEEYQRKFDEAKKRETSLENDLAGMWVLVAKLKKGASGLSELNSDERLSDGVDPVNDQKENKNELVDKHFRERQVSEGPMEPLNGQLNQNSELEPLLVRLKAKIQEMKEKEVESIGNGDINSHVCKVCFESPSAAVLLPCRHFCLCKPCSLACLECPLCRGQITDRIITFTS